jgi:alpha-galactosidase/6-phospho-beta-glucosidase family protein
MVMMMVVMGLLMSTPCSHTARTLLMDGAAGRKVMMLIVMMVMMMMTLAVPQVVVQTTDSLDALKAEA